MSTRTKIKQAIKLADSPCLRAVVTLAEAVELSGMSRTALINAVIKNRLQARRSITGGEWLIDLASLISEYPSTEIKTWLVK